MSLVKFGGGVIDIRGKLGGNVFSKNKSGNYIRGLTIPNNPNSERQQAVRNDMGNVVNAWFTVLSVAERASWDVYAANIVWTNKLGESIKLSGYNHFVRCNISRRAKGYSLTTAGPVVLVLPSTDPDFEINVSEGSQLMTVVFDDTADWCSENSAAMNIHQGLPVNSATGYFGDRFRRLGMLEGSAGTPITSPQTIALSFPAAVSQKNWGFGTIQREDGRLSIPFRDVCIVGA